YDILRLTEDQEDALGVRFALFTELLRTSDIVTLHVPLNDVTRKMMSTRELSMMKRSAVLINTCRGPVVDEDALHQALTSGTIAAAGLDVMVRSRRRRTIRSSRSRTSPSRRTAPGRRGTTGRRRTATASTTSSAWRPDGRRSGWFPSCATRSDSSSRPTQRRCDSFRSQSTAALPSPTSVSAWRTAEAGDEGDDAASAVGAGARDGVGAGDAPVLRLADTRSVMGGTGRAAGVDAT